LRRMTPDDLPHVLAIEHRSFTNPWQPSAFEGEINNYPISNPLVMIFRPQKKVVGYIIFWRLGEEIQISNFAVHPDFRRLGLAETVLKARISPLKENGAAYIVLEVRPSNKGARALYEKLGFEVWGIRKDYYKSPTEDAQIMALRLN